RPGLVSLAFPREAQSPLGMLEVAGESKTRAPFYLSEGQNYVAQPARYVPATHSITWTVNYGDKPAAGLLVELYDGANLPAKSRPQDDGRVYFPVEKVGLYKVKAPPDPKAFGAVVETDVPVDFHSGGVTNTTNLPMPPDENGAPTARQFIRGPGG